MKKTKELNGTHFNVLMGASRHLNTCLNIAKKYEDERLRLSLNRSAMNISVQKPS